MHLRHPVTRSQFVKFDILKKKLALYLLYFVNFAASCLVRCLFTSTITELIDKGRSIQSRARFVEVDIVKK